MRCEGCGVMHHPACWVRNNGCVTETDHRQSPLAQAYSGLRPIGGLTAHPGEGVRLSGNQPPPLPAPHERAPVQPRRPSPAADSVIGAEDTEDEAPVIGRAAAGAAAREAPRPGREVPVESVARPTPPRRYQAPPGDPAVRKPLPRVYGRHRIFDYWYLPVAVLIAVAVAGAVIWGSEQIFGGNGDGTPASGAGATGPAAPNLPTTVRGSVTPGASATPSPATTGPAGKFRAQEAATVASPGECLNLRPTPGLANQPIGCLDDGTQVTVLGGPQSVEQITWWNVSTAQGDGWVAEDYLAKKP